MRKPRRFPVQTAPSLSGKLFIPFVLFAFAWAFLSFLSVRDNAIGLLSDTYVYMLLADFFSPFRTIDAGFANYLLQSYSYPPGYPVLLGLLGGGSEALPVNYIIDAGFLAATIGAYCIWLMQQNLSRLPALGICLVFLALPITVISSLGLFSEHPYMLVLLIASIVLNKCENSRAIYWAAAIIGLATLIRSVGLAAVAAVIIYSFQRRSVGRSLSVAGVALLPSIAWSTIKTFGGYDQSYVGAVYTGDAFQFVSKVLDQLPINTRAFWYHFQQCLSGESSGSIILSGILLSAMTLGFFIRLSRFRFEALYVLFYFLLIFAWPYPNHFSRFIYAVLPFLLYFGYVGFSLAIQVITSKKIGCYKHGFTVLILAVVASAQGSTTSISYVAEILRNDDTKFSGLARSPNWHRLPERIREKRSTDLFEILNAMVRARELVPAKACISSGQPHFIHYFSRRRSRKPEPQSEEQRVFEENLRGCPYVFMMSVKSYPPTEYPAMYPYQRIKDNMVVLDVSFFEANQRAGTVRSMLAATGTAKDLVPAN